MPTHLIVGLLSLVLGAVPTWFWQANAYSARIAAMEKEQAEQTATAIKKALDDTLTLQRKKDAALKAAEVRAAALRAAAAGAAAESDSLRAQLSEARVQLSSATCSSVVKYADTLNQLFDQCQTRLGALARAADGHALDARTLTESWPKQ